MPQARVRATGPPSASGRSRLAPVISVKGSREWVAWLDGLAKKVRATKAGAIDRALAELAERVGYEEPPAR